MGSPRPGTVAARLVAIAAWVCAISTAVLTVGADAQAAAGHRSSSRTTAEVRLAGDAPVGLARGAVRGRSSHPGRPLTITVMLKRAHQASFDRYLRSVQNRGSAQSAHYLSQTQLADRFGPTRSRYRSLLRWLSTEGFMLVRGSANRLSITVRGTRAQAEQAFRTPIVDIRERSGADYANLRAPAVPRALGSGVLAVIGLSTAAQPAAVPSDVYTCQHGYSANVAGCGPNQCLAAAIGGVPGHIEVHGWGLAGAIANAFAAVGNALLQIPGKTVTAAGLYGPDVIAYCLGTSLGASNPQQTCNILVAIGQLPAGSCGPTQPKPPCKRCRPHHRHTVRQAEQASSAVSDGDPPTQKIGLLEYDTYRPSDVSDWMSLLGLDPSVGAKLSEVNVNGGVATPGAGESEVLLDIAAVLGGAPLSASSYVVYDAPASTSFVQMFQTMIADGDTVISNSWSQCEDQTPVADAQAIDEILSEAAASGISVVNGTGDNGSSCLDGSPDTIGVPADSPNALAVGGTTPTFGPGLTYAHETYWSTPAGTPGGGAGGYGLSRYFPTPDYQQGIAGASMRSVPDVSFAADPSAGAELCEADGGGCPNGRLYGGTSMAAPAVASEIANLNQELGQNVGDLNATLYPLSGTDAFNTPHSMDSDFAHVGLGSPRFGAIYQALTETTTGTPSDTESRAFGLDQPQADGSDPGLVRVDLVDANGFPVGGRTVTVTPISGSAAVSPATSVTDQSTGSAVFTVTDTTAESVTFTVKDTTDGVTLATQPTLTFATPVATGAEIYGGPSTVPNDGSSKATITVYLENDLSQPAAGKTVSLSKGGGNATITPAGSSTPATTAVTDSAGNATFHVTDTSAESVNLTAADASDNNLPVPGSVTINFAPGGASCETALPTASSGHAVSAFATGFAYTTEAIVYPGNFTEGACTSFESAPAFDPSGNAYIADASDGTIHVLGPSGGTPSAANALPDTHFPGGSLGQLAFGRDGSLYAGLIQSGGSVSNPEIVQLDPSTGATERVVASQATGLPDCPFVLVVDPLSGDLFTDDECSGFAASAQISRIEHPAGASPTVVNYLNTGTCNLGLAFAPDGTLYVANCNGEVDSIGGTDTTNPSEAKVATVTGAPFAVAVSSVGSSGRATSLDVFGNDGNVTDVDLATTPATTTSAAAGSSHFFITAVGANGCGYGSIAGTIVKVGPSSCGSSSTTGGPALTLTTDAADNPPTGSPIGLSATLQNVTGPAGTPVHFAIAGSNSDNRLVDADGSGQATMSYAGVSQGVDSVTASAVVNGQIVTSAPVQVHWTAGKHTSFLSLNASQLAGPAGRPVELTANLTDITQPPAAPIVGAAVTLSLSGDSCQASTDDLGNASCSVTTSGGTRLAPITGSYAGDSAYTAATASNVFVLGALGLSRSSPPPPPPGGSAPGSAPVNTARPSISGTPRPGDMLTCSTGTWSNSPTSYAYQFKRGGKPIAGATNAKHAVQIVDEATVLTCTVTASNAHGAGAPATSAGVLVALPGTARCPKPSGRLSGATLGRLRLGMSRARARRTLKRFGVTHNGFDNFCLYGGWGIRAGYPSAKLLRTLPRAERRHVTGVILLSTANPFYALDKVRPGARLTKAIVKRLHLAKPFRIGRNSWYIVPGHKGDGVLKVQRSVIQEVGAADKRLLHGRRAQHRFFTSFSNT